MPELKYTFKNLSRKEIIDIIFIVSKISIIVFVSIWVIGGTLVFYNGADSKLYGVAAIDLANGEFGFTNELLQETGKWQFVPGQYVKTVHNTAIPKSNFGIIGLSSVAYLVAGLQGLFYLGPIITIILLISSERIATNLFGRGAGLATLLLVATDFAILNGGLRLLTDNIFSLFLIFGCFFLIKFLQKKRNSYIFLCSSLFSLAAFFRITGIIFFPFEILIIIGYVIITQIIFKQNKSIEKKILKNFKQNLFTKKIFITSTMVLVPWIIFLIFLFSYNAYFFGDPLTPYHAVRSDVDTLQEGSSLFSFLTFDQDRFEWIKFYLTGFVPDEIQQNVQYASSDDGSWNNTLNWIGVFSIMILAAGLFMAMKEKTKRVEIIILILFALSFPLFYSAAYLHAEKYVDTKSEFIVGERYMVPSFLMLSLIFGFIMQKIWSIYLNNNSTFRQKKSLALKSIFFVIFFTFFLFSIYYSPPVEDLTSSSFIIKNTYAEKYTNWIPTDLKDLPSDSIVLATKPRRAIEGDAIIFHAGYGIQEMKTSTLENTPSESIKMLKEYMNSGYNVFTFKNNKWKEEGYFRYLINDQGFVLTEYSKTFCKLELNEKYEIDINNFTKIQSDRICIKEGLNYTSKFPENLIQNPSPEDFTQKPPREYVIPNPYR